MGLRDSLSDNPASKCNICTAQLHKASVPDRTDMDTVHLQGIEITGLLCTGPCLSQQECEGMQAIIICSSLRSVEHL